MNVNQTAFCTVTALAIATISSAVLAATAATSVGAVAYGILAALGSALSIASMTAYASLAGRADKEDSASEYFTEVSSHAGFAIAAVFQFIGQTLMVAVVEGIGRGITRSIERRFE